MVGTLGCPWPTSLSSSSITAHPSSSSYRTTSAANSSSIVSAANHCRCRCSAYSGTSSSRASEQACLSWHGQPGRLVVAPVCQQQQQLQHTVTAALLQPAAMTWLQQLGSSTSSTSRRAVTCSSIGNGTRSASSYSTQQASSSRQGLFVDSQQQQQQPDGGRSRLLQQRQAAAAWEEEQQQQQWQQQQQQMDAVGEVGGYVVPRQRFVLRPAKRYSAPNWYTQPQYNSAAALHAAILARCGQGRLEADALRYLLASASNKRDAQLALSALGAVRSVAVARGHMAPWSDSFVKTFVRMAALCDAHEVLLSAMQRPNELGLVFKWKSLLAALKHWGDQGAAGVDKLGAIVFAMESAGLRPDAKAVYVLVRAYVNAKEFTRVDAALVWFGERGVRRFKPAMLPLLAKAAEGGSEGAAAVLAAAQQGGSDGVSEGSESDEEGQGMGEEKSEGQVGGVTRVGSAEDEASE